MAVTGLRLDGQTIGLQLSAPTTQVSLFTLDVSSGAITSGTDSAGTPFLTATDILNLKPVVDELFALVPLADRGAAMPGFLSKILTVTAADQSAVSFSIAFAPPFSVTYRVDVAAAPAYLVAHLPFAPDGNIAWGSSGSAVAPVLPISLANGGLGTDVSGYVGLVAIAGSALPLPVVKMVATIGAEVANVRKLTLTAKNALDNSAYALGGPMTIGIENLAGTFTISQGGGYKGSIQYNNLASNRRAILQTDNNGIVEIDVTDALVETATIGWGPGPNVFMPEPGIIVGSAASLSFT